MLKLNEVTSGYKGMEALKKVSLNLMRDEFISVIGPNGAGKSTLLKTISGTVRCASGEIHFADTNVTTMDPYKRTRLGIIHIPENRRVFPSLSVIGNLELGAYNPEARPFISENLKVVLDLFPRLKERQKQLAGSLSGGEQQMLAIGRGLMAMPKILMLDEPSLGLSPLLGDMIFEAIKNIREKLKCSILLVEQRAVEALELCDRGYILETGKISLSSDRETLLGNPMVQKAYLGTV